MKKVELQSAHLLYSRPYLESSLLIEIFTREHGRVAMVARGAKRGKFPKFAMLQPFIPLLISWYGNGPLYTMSHVETSATPVLLQARKLISGLYINELLVRLLAIGDPHVELFDCYQQTIQHLLLADTEQEVLRIFEKRLLIAIGYGLPLLKNIATAETVLANDYYAFDLERGPQRIANYTAAATDIKTRRNIFRGSSLLALYNEQFNCAEELIDAKRLLRLALTLRLGEQPLHTRKLL